MDMNKQPRSLRSRLLLTTLLCWVLPILIVVTLAGLLLRSNYEQNIRQQLETDADYALQQVEMRFEAAFEDSKAVSYDGVVRNAYRAWQQDGDSVALYRSINDYLALTFSRNESYKAVFISFWEDINIYPYVMSSGITGYSLPRNYHRSTEPLILQEMRDADTAIRLLSYDGELYIARNLLDSRFEPYATVVLLCERNQMFQSLEEMRRISGVTLVMDGLVLDRQGTLHPVTEENTQESDLRFAGDLEGHTLELDVSIEPYDILADMPGLRAAVLIVVLLVLPLLLVMIQLFRHHVTRPVEALLGATDRLQSGERGYQIEEKARSREFERIFRHFNNMSAELKNQFERSYLEQQALQQARVKALQSQINPHFLNNTLEVINWEARLSGDERVSAMIEALSVMLDAALGRDGRSQIHLREELSYVDAYLYIIRERLGERLEIVRELDESMMDEMVPRLILQPLVENAVEHDITPRRGGKLCLRIRREDGCIVLEAEHDGTISVEDQKAIEEMLSSAVTDTEISGQVGLRNVRQRLYLLYGEQGRLSVTQSGPDRILAQVSFPASDKTRSI